MANFIKKLLFLTIICFYNGFCENINGVVQLNAGTFDKIIGRFDAAVVKFDQTYPYGDAQDAFKEVTESLLSHENLIMTEVHVADYGEKENQELADRYGLKKEDFPHYKLFVKGRDEPYTFTGDPKQVTDVQKFIAEKSGLWIGLAGCTEELDTLVESYFRSNQKTRSDLQAQAEKYAEDSDYAGQDSAKVYGKYMSKIAEKASDGFIDDEADRVNKLIQQGKVSTQKLEQLKLRSNILTSFKAQKERAKKEGAYVDAFTPSGEL